MKPLFFNTLNLSPEAYYGMTTKEIKSYEKRAYTMKLRYIRSGKNNSVCDAINLSTELSALVQEAVEKACTLNYEAMQTGKRTDYCVSDELDELLEEKWCICRNSKASELDKMNYDEIFSEIHTQAEKNPYSWFGVWVDLVYRF